jgi:hypothetical protein
LGTHRIDCDFSYVKALKRKRRKDKLARGITNIFIKAKPQGVSAPAVDGLNHQVGQETCPAGGALNRRWLNAELTFMQFSCLLSK